MAKARSRIAESLEIARIVVLYVAVAGLLTATAKPLAAADSAHESPPTLRWSERVTAHGDAGRWLEIQPDGATSLHVPDFLRGAGDFELQLNPEEFEALIYALAADLSNFDARTVEADKRAARLRSHTVPSVSGAALTAFEMIVEPRFTDDLTRTTPRHVAVQWRGIGWDARHFPDIPQVQALERAQQAMLDLFEHPRVRRLDREQP